jgi:hypothetical protein
MTGFSQTERDALLEPLGGLQVDPTKEGISMQQISAGDAGKTGGAKPDLSEAYEEFGKKAVDAAYARGWRPKSEHQGNPDNWVDPIDFFARYAETSDKRAEKAADRKLQGIMATVEKRIGEVAKRVDRIDETDRQATEEYYAGVIAKAKPQDIPKLLKDRDTALAEIDKSKATGTTPAAKTDGGTDVLPETIEFFEKFPHILNPQTPDDVSQKAWAAARASELEAKYPQAAPAQIYKQLTAELERKMTPATTTKNNGGRNLSDNGGGGNTTLATPGKLTPADLTREQQQAFQHLVGLGAYKDGDIQKYCDGLAETLAEEAMSNGKR